MLYSRSQDYMFRPVVAIIRSLSFDSLKIILYNCVAAYLMRRSQHQGLCLSIIYLYRCVGGPLNDT